MRFPPPAFERRGLSYEARGPRQAGLAGERVSGRLRGIAVGRQMQGTRLAPGFLATSKRLETPGNQDGGDDAGG